MIRQAKRKDSKKIWQIRNHPLCRKQSNNPEKINFKIHNKWFVDKYFRNKDNYCFVLEEKNDEVIGYCRLDLDDNSYIISIAIDPNYYEKGFGSKLLKESLKEIKRMKKDTIILAEVKKRNIPSIKLFEKCNFCSYKEDKKNLYYKYDIQKAIVILGGIIKKEKGEWGAGNLEENEIDKFRIIAADYLYQEDKSQFLIASGGNKWVKDIPDALLATVIKKELIEYGVPTKKIIKENKSNNTYQQLQELKKIIIKQKLQQITIISNDYHLPRVKVMIEKDIKLNKMLTKDQLIIQSAEEIIIKHEPEQEKKIKAAYKSKDMQKRIALEQKGIKDIKQGKYNG